MVSNKKKENINTLYFNNIEELLLITLNHFTKVIDM